MVAFHVISLLMYFKKQIESKTGTMENTYWFGKIELGITSFVDIGTIIFTYKSFFLRKVR